MKKYIIIISFAAASLSLGSAAAQTYIYGNRIRSNMENTTICTRICSARSRRTESAICNSNRKG